MSSLINEYEEITNKRKQIEKEIKKLEKNPIIKEYFELIKENEKLYRDQINMQEELIKDKFSSCNHIFINIKKDPKKICGCIKCKLTDDVLLEERSLLSYNQKIMYDYLKNNKNIYNDSIISNVTCDLELAKAIYDKIIENYNNIDDETVKKYFEIALDNIRTNKVNSQRQVNRAKRLKLNIGFNRWK